MKKRITMGIAALVLLTSCGIKNEEVNVTETSIEIMDIDEVVTEAPVTTAPIVETTVETTTKKKQLDVLVAKSQIADELKEVIILLHCFEFYNQEGSLFTFVDNSQLLLNSEFTSADSVYDVLTEKYGDYVAEAFKAYIKEFDGKFIDSDNGVILQHNGGNFRGCIAYAQDSLNYQTVNDSEAQVRVYSCLGGNMWSNTYTLVYNDSKEIWSITDISADTIQVSGTYKGDYMNEEVSNYVTSDAYKRYCAIKKINAWVGTDTVTFDRFESILMDLVINKNLKPNEGALRQCYLKLVPDETPETLEALTDEVIIDWFKTNVK